ncbi:2Fe-2S iron-sulfur cluster-binding protein [Geobacillus stearothermophilus]|uniref:2Fe-2S iron-sulfur cluster-binding protein n=1 Tax=Geobacillus stearothermophilus TaxID=1422 RepID=UPI002E1A4991|nr:2Fe-2S iron-sulfur cluster-binding protein [Geobacillus stearothermophilus]MED5077918.1 2Fe-2S iron-sulfur cluster-binding protein [Geobacillus stearothermophilus]
MEQTFTVGSLKPATQSSARSVPSVQLKPNAPLAAPTAVLQIEQQGKTFTVQRTPGVSLLDAALGQGVLLDHKCKKGTCGRCMVTVLAGAHLLAPKTRHEREKTSAPSKRLACQAQMK